MSRDDATGRRGTIRSQVSEADLAIALGSGDVPVLATPRVLAWLEAATVAAIEPELAEGTTTVGVSATVDHLLATPVGAVVDAVAVVSGRDGRMVDFDCQATHRVGDGPPQTVARGTVRRAVVDRQRFLAGVGAAG